jgi:hypothetical protein
MVGLGMIVLALAVLIGAVVLVNRPPQATPTRAIGPSASPGPSSGTAGSSGLPTASATASASASPGPSPTASPFVPIVQVGPGYVTFGTRVKDDNTIADPRASFALNQTLAWSGHLLAPADSADLTVRLLILDAQAPDGERLLSEGGALPRAANAVLFSRTIKHPERVLEGPGIYVVRYQKGDAVLAEGYFEVHQ